MALIEATAAIIEANSGEELEEFLTAIRPDIERRVREIHPRRVEDPQ